MYKSESPCYPPNYCLKLGGLDWGVHAEEVPAVNRENLRGKSAGLQGHRVLLSPPTDGNITFPAAGSGAAALSIRWAVFCTLLPFCFSLSPF